MFVRHFTDNLKGLPRVTMGIAIGIAIGIHQLEIILHAKNLLLLLHTHTHTHPFSGPLSGTTRVSRYQKGKTNLDFTEARDSEWQWHQLGRMQVCISLQTDNHASTPPLSFLQAGCPSCRPTYSVKALKELLQKSTKPKITLHVKTRSAMKRLLSRLCR